MLARTPPEARVVILADRGALEARAAMLGLLVALPDYVPGVEAPISLLNLPAPAPVTPGHLDPANGPYVLETLRRAVAGCLSGGRPDCAPLSGQTGRKRAQSDK